MRTQKETDLEQEVERLTAELEHMTGCRDTQHSIACNLDEETKRLQARVDALEAVVNGGEYDDPYGVWDRVCKYQTAAAEQEGE